MSSILALLVLVALAAYLMTPEERARAARAVLARVRRLRNARGEDAPLVRALKARTRYPLVTLALMSVHTLVYALILFDQGADDYSAILIRWGANFPPRTTNGEWWRLLTTLFVHAGFLHLLATLVGLAPLGVTLERLVGPIAFASVYLSAGLLAGTVSLYSAPVGVSVGPSGAIFGLYGLLCATLTWSVITRPRLQVPLRLVNALGLAAAVFILYNLWADSLRVAAETAGFATGLVGGLLLARGIVAHKPRGVRIARTATAAAIMAIVSAVPLRGLTDVTPRLDAIDAFERRTSAAYDDAVDAFRRGRSTSKALVHLIENTILPELQRARAPLRTLSKMPREQMPLVTAAEEYCQLREEAWRLRAAALRRSSLPGLREADRVERSALDALRRTKAVQGGRPRPT